MACLISVITPLLNRAAMLPDALASLAAQNSVAFEHIVVDGGSTDGSQAIAAASGALVIDAPGSSIYEAINLGLDRARGDIICLLNSDDRLTPGALAAALSAFAAQSELDLVRGRALVETSISGRWQPVALPAEDQEPHLPGILLGRSSINACFFRTALVRRIGTFNPAYPISADREWLARALVSGACTAGIDATVYVYRAHPGSLTIGKSRPATAQWVREHLVFSRAMLREARLTRRDRSALRAFHAKETVHFATLLLSRGRLRDVASEIARSFRSSPLWPLHAVTPLGDILRRRLRF